MGSAEEACDRSGGVGAEQPVGAAMADAHLGEAVEIAQEVLPFGDEAGFTREIVEMLLQARPPPPQTKPARKRRGRPRRSATST